MTTNNSSGPSPSTGSAAGDAARTEPEGPVKLLMWLERLPKVAVFLAVLVITIGVLMTPGPVGAVLTLLLAGGSAFLVYATWPKQTARAARVARVVVVLALVALGIGKLFL